MGIFDSVLLASDFDGTLTDSKGNIPDKNIEYIKYFIAEGGKFTVSTGRTKVGFHNYSEELINAPVLLGNGAMAFDYKNNCVAFTNPIIDESIETLCKIISTFPDIGMEIYSVDHKTYVVNPNELNYRHFSGLKVETFSEIKNIDKLMFPFVKVMLSVGERTFEVQDYLKNIDLGNIKYIPSSGSFVEILSIDAGKGNALHQLSEYFGIKHEHTYAVGDASNDVDMLISASVGFVPKSGDEYAKSVANRIVCNSDSGCVANVIEILAEKYS